MQKSNSEPGSYEKDTVDGSIFVSSMNPLRLTHKETKSDLFINDCPQSSHCNRPIAIKNAKETTELTLKVKTRLKIIYIKPEIFLNEMTLNIQLRKEINFSDKTMFLIIMIIIKLTVTFVNYFMYLKFI